MRPIAFLPVLIVLAIGIGLIAANTGGSPAGLTASAQGEAPILTYDQLEIPFFDSWVRSPHADLTSRSFTYWNNSDPVAVPARCAKCHANEGYHDFVGYDGAARGAFGARDWSWRRGHHDAVHLYRFGQRDSLCGSQAGAGGHPRGHF